MRLRPEPKTLRDRSYTRADQHVGSGWHSTLIRDYRLRSAYLSITLRDLSATIGPAVARRGIGGMAAG